MILGIIIGFVGCLVLQGVGLFMILNRDEKKNNKEKLNPMFSRERFYGKDKLA